MRSVSETEREGRKGGRERRREAERERNWRKKKGYHCAVGTINSLTYV